MKTKITSESYSLVERALDENYSVKLKTPKYLDVIVRYGKITMKVNESTDTATLAFNYTISECPPNLKSDDLTKDPEFNNHLGDVLSFIIQDAFDNGKYRMSDAFTKKKKKEEDVQSTPDDGSAEANSR